MQSVDFDRLKLRLLQGGVANKYIERTLKELRNHLAELVEQEKSGGAAEAEAHATALQNLGDENKIIQEILNKPELKSFPHRFPKTVFLISPVLLYPLLTIPLVVLVAGVIPEYAGIEHWEYWPVWYDAVASSTAFTVEYLIAPMMAILVYLYARHNHVNNKWPIVGIALMSFLACGWENTAAAPGEYFQRANLLFHWGYAFMPWRIVQSDWATTLEQLIRIGVNLGLILVLEKYLYGKHSKYS